MDQASADDVVRIEDLDPAPPRQWYVVRPAFTEVDIDDPNEKCWTISLSPSCTGWVIDHTKGADGGLTKGDAIELARAYNSPRGLKTVVSTAWQVLFSGRADAALRSQCAEVMGEAQ